MKTNLFLLIEVEEPSVPLSESNCTSLLEKVRANPDYLIGRKIRHRFEVDEELIWFNGTVLHRSSETNEYQVKYEGENDICSFALLDDISSGDLILM